MMQEVSTGEDTNGSESTFEFVEDKLDDLSIGGNGSTPSAPHAHSGHVQAGSQPQETVSGSAFQSSVAPPLPITVPSTLATPGPTDQIFSNVPPPAALPSFLALQSPDSGPPPVRPVIPISQPIYSPMPSVPVSSQPMLSSTPSATAAPQYSVYAGSAGDPGLSSDLPLPDYDYSNSLAAISEGGAGAGGMWGWIKGSGNEFLHKVAEKAKSSVDNMITTLDPQMKDYIFSGGDIDVIVASDKEDKIAPIKEAFQVIFGRASVIGRAAQAEIAAQPVGFSAGLKGAEDRVKQLRQSGAVHERQPVIALENFLAELTPERWFDIGCLILNDPDLGETIQVYTQATPVALDYVNQMQSETPADYPLRWSGFASSVGNVVARSLQVTPQEWHMAVSGHSRRSIILMAAKTLAHLYKQKRDEYGATVGKAWQ